LFSLRGTEPVMATVMMQGSLIVASSQSPAGAAHEPALPEKGAGVLLLFRQLFSAAPR
jgi:hypothetical protein